MAIPGMSGASAPEPSYSTPSPSTIESEDARAVFSANYDEFEQENFQRGQIAKQQATDFIKDNANNISYTHKWFDTDYITFTPPEGSTMTYGQLRKQLGIPPGLISKTNPPEQSFIDRILGKPVPKDEEVIDKNVIKKTIKIPVDQIGWFERRMDDVEAVDARGQRANGNPYGGYDRNFKDNSEVSDMVKQYVKDQR